MRISVCYVSNRAGCIDLLKASLVNQQDPGDWELVVVDGYSGRVERGDAEQFLLATGLPVRAYVPPKPKTFPWSRTGFTNAMNTAIMHAGGSHVVFLHDYTQLQFDALANWRAAFTAYPKTLISGIATEYLAPKPTKIDDVFTWEEANVPLKALKQWIPDDFEVFYWGCPVELFDLSNGIDERADFCSQFALYSLKEQAKVHGYGLQVNHSLLCHAIDHRAWDDGKWTDPKNSDWRMKGVYSDVPQEPVWTGWGANPFNMKLERARLEHEYGMAVKPHPRYYMVPTQDVPKETRLERKEDES